LPAFAIPERDYLNVWKRDILGPLDSVPAMEFTNAQGKKVRYRTYYRGAGLPNIVVSPGQSEPMKKYFELIHDIPNANFYLIDHQGQGESERLLKDPQKCHVEHFQDFVNDFTWWMENYVIPQTRGEKLFLIAHSMGGAISTRFMETHPTTFDKVAFSAPMYDVYTKPYPGSVARVIAKTLMLAGRGNSYAPGKGPYKPEEDVLGKNHFSHSADRIEMNKYLFVDQHLGVGGVTVRWVDSAFKGMKGIENVGKKLSMPILLMQAENDMTVKPQKQLEFCMNAKNCELVHMMGAYHEILQEQDVIRDLAFKLIRDHFGL
jgi:lysophospholipase